MATSISSLNAKVTANTIQFQREMDGARRKVRQFSDETQAAHVRVAKNVNSMLKPGDIGRMQRGLFRLAAAATTTWAAFQAGQRIRDHLTRFFEGGAAKARRFAEELRASLDLRDPLQRDPSQEEFDKRRKAMEATRAELLRAQESFEAKMKALRAVPITGFTDPADRRAAAAMRAMLSRETFELGEHQIPELQKQLQLKTQEFEITKAQIEAKSRAARTEEMSAARLKVLRDAAGVITDPQEKFRLKRLALRLEAEREIAKLQERLQHEREDRERAHIMELIDLAKLGFSTVADALEQELADDIAEKKDKFGETTFGKRASLMIRGAAADQLFSAPEPRKDKREEQQLRLTTQIKAELTKIEANTRDSGVAIPF